MSAKSLTARAILVENMRAPHNKTLIIYFKYRIKTTAEEHSPDLVHRPSGQVLSAALCVVELFALLLSILKSAFCTVNKQLNTLKFQTADLSVCGAQPVI
jgi:hypothetical protein